MTPLFSTLISNPIANYLGSPPETSRGWTLLTPLILPSSKLLSSLACFIAKLTDSCWSLNATACSFSLPYFSAIAPIVYLYMAVRAVLLKQIRSCQSYVGDAFFFLFFSYLFFLFSFFYLEWVSTVISNALHSQYAHYHFSLSLSTLPLHSCLPQLFTCCSLFISRMFLPQGFCTCYLFFKTSCLIWPWLTPSVHGFLQCHLPSRVLYDPLFKIILILPTQKSKSPFPEFSPKLFYFYWHIWFIFGLPKPELSTMRGEIWGFCSIHL